MNQSNTGSLAKHALMTLVGESRVEFEELVQLLIAKDVISEDEWEHALNARYARVTSAADWASHCINPEDNDALDAFFHSG